MPPTDFGRGEERKALARQLFGLKEPDAFKGFGTAAAGDEAQRKMASHISTAILADLVQQVQKAWRTLGPGVLVIRRACDDAIWSDQADIKQQLYVAEQQGDTGMAAVLASMLDQLDDLDIEETVLIAITATKAGPDGATGGSIRLLRIPATNPARNIAALLDQWNS